MEDADDSTGFASTSDSDRRTDFDFSVYLTLSVQKNALELLDVRKTSWIAFSSVIGLNWIRYVIWIAYDEAHTSSSYNSTGRYLAGSYDDSEGVISDDNPWIFAYFLIGVGFFVLLTQLLLLFIFEDTINTLIARHGTSLLIPGGANKRMSKSSSLFRLLNILLVATMEKDRIDAERMNEQTSSDESKALKKHKKKQSKLLKNGRASRIDRDDDAHSVDNELLANDMTGVNEGRDDRYNEIMSDLRNFHDSLETNTYKNGIVRYSHENSYSSSENDFRDSWSGRDHFEAWKTDEGKRGLHALACFHQRHGHLHGACLHRRFQGQYKV